MEQIDPFYLYSSFKSYVNTSQNGWFRPQTDFIQAANDISNELWETETKKAEKSQESRDNLIFYLKSKNIIVKSEKSSFGKFIPPPDYGRFASARLIVAGGKKTVPAKDVEDGKCDGWKSDEELAEDYYNSVKEVSIENVDNQRWSSVTEHLTKGPTLQNPKLTQIDEGFKLSPRQVSVVVLDYYVRPTNAIFAYTKTPGNVQTGAGDQIVYDKSKSKPLQWPTTMINEFVIRLGIRYGLFTREQFMANIATQQKATTK